MPVAKPVAVGGDTQPCLLQRGDATTPHLPWEAHRGACKKKSSQDSRVGATARIPPAPALLLCVVEPPDQIPPFRMHGLRTLSIIKIHHCTQHLLFFVSQPWLGVFGDGVSTPKRIRSICITTYVHGNLNLFMSSPTPPFGGVKLKNFLYLLDFSWMVTDHCVFTW